MTDQCVMVGTREVNAACDSLKKGSRDFIAEVRSVLYRSTGYSDMLDRAQQFDHHRPSVEAGFIAGLKAASILGNFNYQFLLEKGQQVTTEETSNVLRTS